MYTTELLHYLRSHATLSYVLLGLGGSMVSVLTHAEKIDKAWLLETVVHYDFTCVLGLGSLHQAAHWLGIVPGVAPQPLQWQLGWAYLGVGIAGLLAYWTDWGLRAGVLGMYAGLIIGPSTYGLVAQPTLDWVLVARVVWQSLLPLLLHGWLLQRAWRASHPGPWALPPPVCGPAPADRLLLKP